MTVITVPFNPHRYQNEIIKSLKRFSVLVCHRRFGKTVLTVNLLNKWALQTKRESWRAGYIAPLYRQAEEIAWDYLKHYAQYLPNRLTYLSSIQNLIASQRGLAFQHSQHI